MASESSTDRKKFQEFRSKRSHKSTSFFGSKADAARWVRDALRAQILEGVFEVGESKYLLPSEIQLIEQYGVSRNAVREALNLLKAEGLVQRIPGSGTFVLGKKLYQNLQQLEGLAESLDVDAKSMHNKVLAWGEIEASNFVASKLQITTGTKVLFIERLRVVNSIPLSLETSYLRVEVAPVLTQKDIYSQDVFFLVEQYLGSSLGWANITIEAVDADYATARLLEVEEKTSLLLIHRITHLKDGTPFDLESLRYRGDRFCLGASLLRSKV